MWNKVIQPLVLGPARANALQKPVLIIAITDGTPAGENKDEIFSVIQRTDAELRRTRYGPDAISYRKFSICDDVQRATADEQNSPRLEMTRRRHVSSRSWTTTQLSVVSSTARPTLSWSRKR